MATSYSLQKDMRHWHVSNGEPLKFESYGERLQSLNPFSSEYRRLRGDFLMTYSILNTSRHLKHQSKPSRNTNLRGSTPKLETQHNRMYCRHAFYFLRVIKFWNSLLAELVQWTSQESSRRKLGIFLRTKNSHYDLLLLFSSFVVSIPCFLFGGMGEPLLLDTKTNQVKVYSVRAICTI